MKEAQKIGKTQTLFWGGWGLWGLGGMGGERGRPPAERRQGVGVGSVELGGGEHELLSQAPLVLWLQQLLLWDLWALLVQRD